MREISSLQAENHFEESAHVSEYGSIDMHEVIQAMADLITLAQFVLTTEE